MEIDSSGLRQRRGITKIVEDLDMFDKVVESVKEEKRVSSALLSFFFFGLICLLFITETSTFLFPSRNEYRFGVDTAMFEKPVLDIDMIVATPCNQLQVLNSAESANGMINPMQPALKKDPTRFDFTDEEQMYWTVLRHAHAELNRQGLRGIEDLAYIDSDVESNLEHLADEKQREEAEVLAVKRKEDGKKNGGHQMGQVMFIVGNGMGMFQLVSDNVGGGENEGTACRIHGKFPVSKSKEQKVIISIGNQLIFMNHMEGKSVGNVSHRIEKFNFGPRIGGLVTPLAGAEHISESGQDVYRYFIKVVPTRIHGYFSKTMAYQYSVTFLKKKVSEGEHTHGGILLEYEFTANVIEVRKASVSLVTYLVRLCSILGGVYATSIIVNSVVQTCLSFVYPSEESRENVHGSQQDSTTSDSALLIDGNIKVH